MQKCFHNEGSNQYWFRRRKVKQCRPLSTKVSAGTYTAPMETFDTHM